MRAQPLAPTVCATPLMPSRSWLAHARDTSAWTRSRMLIVNTLDVVMLGNTRESLLTLTSTSGGSSETLVNAETVIARGKMPSNVVTTVTPLGQHANAVLKSDADTVTFTCPFECSLSC